MIDSHCDAHDINFVQHLYNILCGHDEIYKTTKVFHGSAICSLPHNNKEILKRIRTPRYVVALAPLFMAH